MHDWVSLHCMFVNYTILGCGMGGILLFATCKQTDILKLTKTDIDTPVNLACMVLVFIELDI